MIKSILLAINDSKAARYALEVACVIAKVTDAKIKGLYVENMLRLLEWQPVELMGAAIGATSAVPHSKPTVEQVEIEKEFIQEAGRIKKLFEDELKKNSIKGSFFTKRGNVDEVIAKVARTVDLIVIGKNELVGAKEPGPVTEYILRRTTKPVIVVPENGVIGENILIAYDSSQSSERALSAGALFASLLGGKVTVVSVADDIDIASGPLDEAKEFLTSHNVKSNYVVEFGYSKPWNAIMSQVKNHNASLIVLGAFGEHRLLEMIFGSTTREVLKQANCPVLLIR